MNTFYLSKDKVLSEPIIYFFDFSSVLTSFIQRNPLKNNTQDTSIQISSLIGNHITVSNKNQSFII